MRTLEALTVAYNLTQNPQTVELDGVPIAMFGTSRNLVDSSVGKVWLLGTDTFSAQRSWIIRNSKAVLDELFQTYSVLWNHVDARQTTHIRWLKWLGFDFISTDERYGYEEIPFHQFAKVV